MSAAIPTREKKYNAAVVDYEKSIDPGAIADGCSRDPYNLLCGLYTEDRRYDQCWAVVRKERSYGKWIVPDFLKRLQKESGPKKLASAIQDIQSQG